MILYQVLKNSSDHSDYKVTGGELVYEGKDTTKQEWFKAVVIVPETVPVSGGSTESSSVKKGNNNRSLYTIDGNDYSYLVDGKEFFVGHSSWFPGYYLAVIEPLETNYDLNYYINPRTTEKNAYNRSYVSCNVPYKFTVYCTSNYNNKPTGDFENKWYIYTEETVKPAGTMSNIMYHTNTYMYLNEIYASDDIYWTTMDTETPTTELAKAENMEMFVSNDGLAYRPSTFSTDISQYRISSANIDYSMLVNGGKDFFLGYSSWFPAWYLGTVEPLEPNANVTFYTNPYDSTYKSYNRVYVTCDVTYKFTVYCTSNYNNLSIADGPQNKWYYYVNETTVPAGSMQNIMYHTYTSMNFTDVQVTNNVKWLQMNTSTPTIGYGKRWSLPRLNTK